MAIIKPRLLSYKPRFSEGTMINFMAKLEIHGDELFLSPGSVNLSHDYTCMSLTNYSCC